MKFFAISTLAAAALTLAACGEIKNEETAVPTDAATETVILNDDGSVKAVETEAVPADETAAAASAVAPVGQQHQL